MYVWCYQPFSISQAIWSPELGLLSALCLELDENAWKISNEKKERMFMGTFNEAEKAKDGKEGEDVVGVHMERCVHCLAAW